MTVAALIRELRKIKDKELDVCIVGTFSTPANISEVEVNEEYVLIY